MVVIMKKKNNNSENNKQEKSPIEEYLDNLDISLSNIEKIGAFFLSLAYSLFILGSNLDILEILDTNNTGISPDDVFLYGEEFILLGYIILWGVSYNRLKVKIYENNNTDDNISLEPYNKIEISYALSVIANAIRLDGFAELDFINRTRERESTRHKAR